MTDHPRPEPVRDIYTMRRERVRHALDHADPDVLRAAVAELLDQKPAEVDQVGRDSDPYTGAADDGWWTCHATFVAIVARKLGLETRT